MLQLRSLDEVGEGADYQTRLRAQYSDVLGGGGGVGGRARGGGARARAAAARSRAATADSAEDGGGGGAPPAAGAPPPPPREPLMQTAFGLSARQPDTPLLPSSLSAGVASVASHGGGAGPLADFWRAAAAQPIVDVDGSEVFVELPEPPTRAST